MMLNDAGAIGFSLNGKSFPATAPIVAKQGEWIEVHYLNEGLMAHPMHLHGMAQTGHRQGRASRSPSPTTPTPSWSPPVSATPCSSTPPSPARGPGTATSSPTPSASRRDVRHGHRPGREVARPGRRRFFLGIFAPAPVGISRERGRANDAQSRTLRQSGQCPGAIRGRSDRPAPSWPGAPTQVVPRHRRVHHVPASERGHLSKSLRPRRTKGGPNDAKAIDDDQARRGAATLPHGAGEAGGCHGGGDAGGGRPGTKDSGTPHRKQDRAGFRVAPSSDDQGSCG